MIQKACANATVEICRSPCSNKKVCPVTVIVPAYNEADCIADTVHRLQAQALAPQEIIVVDDGPTDNTVEIACSLGVTAIAPPENTGTKAGAQTHEYRVW